MGAASRRKGRQARRRAADTAVDTVRAVWQACRDHVTLLPPWTEEGL